MNVSWIAADALRAPLEREIVDELPLKYETAMEYSDRVCQILSDLSATGAPEPLAIVLHEGLHAECVCDSDMAACDAVSFLLADGVRWAIDSKMGMTRISVAAMSILNGRKRSGDARRCHACSRIVTSARVDCSQCAAHRCGVCLVSDIRASRTIDDRVKCTACGATTSLGDVCQNIQANASPASLLHSVTEASEEVMRIAADSTDWSASLKAVIFHMMATMGVDDFDVSIIGHTFMLRLRARHSDGDKRGFHITHLSDPDKIKRELGVHGTPSTAILTNRTPCGRVRGVVVARKKTGGELHILRGCLPLYRAFIRLIQIEAINMSREEGDRC